MPTLRKHAEAILGARSSGRACARWYRVDQFDRFVSILVFVPRDRYDSACAKRSAHYLKTVFEGRLSAYYPAFPEGGLTRVHFIIGRSGGKTPKVEQAAIEAGDPRHRPDLGGRAARGGGRSAAPTPHWPASPRGFPKAIAAASRPRKRCVDADRIAALDADNPIAIDYYRHADQSPSRRR